MGWESGYKNLGGLCSAGSYFDGATNISNYGGSWRQLYNEFITFEQGIAGNDGTGGMLGGLDLGDFRNLNDGETYEVYRLTVNREGGARCEIVCKGTYRAQFTDFSVNLYLRVYTDETHYTDTLYTNWAAFSCATGWYPSGGFNEQTQRVYAVFTNVMRDNIRYVLYGLVQEFYVPWQGVTKYAWSTRAIPYTTFGSWVDGEVVPSKESPEFGKPAKKKGGYNPDHHRKGTFDDSSDTIAISSKPTVSPLNAGFLHEYIMQPADFAHFSDALFKSYYWTQTSVSDVLNEGFEALINRKRVDYVLDCLIVPIQPPYSGVETISVGGEALEWVDPLSGNVYNVTGVAVSDPFVDFSCGSITIPEYWANFLDFSGTRFKLFLPYVGFVDIQPEYVNGGQLKVDYRFNCFDGSFMCFVRSTSGHSELTDSLIGQYAGVAAIHIPLTGQDYSQKISGLISAIGAVGMGIAGNGAASAVAAGGLSSLANTMIQKPGTSHANGYNASSSYLSHRTPYLIIERQSSQFSEKYPSEVGLPYYAMETIKNCRGLVVASKAHLDSVPCTKEGKERIAQLLEEGIIV